MTYSICQAYHLHFCGPLPTIICRFTRPGQPLLFSVGQSCPRYSHAYASVENLEVEIFPKTPTLVLV